MPVDTLSEDPVTWTDIAYEIPKDGEITMEVNWENVYGELPEGDYRLRKAIMDLRAPGDYDTTESFAYFRVHQY